MSRRELTADERRVSRRALGYLAAMGILTVASGLVSFSSRWFLLWPLVPPYWWAARLFFTTLGELEKLRR